LTYSSIIDKITAYIFHRKNGRNTFMGAILGSKKVTQICLVVEDVEKTKAKWADFLGLPVPATSDDGPFEISQMEYKGKPEKDATCVMAGFMLGDELQLDLVEPVGEGQSSWRNLLKDKGEGFHHIAFNVKDTEEKLKKAKAAGYECTQKARYKDGSGMYTYLDTRPELKLTMETLESFEK
jgi:catechol 2,3-dioxygenase-like lactoylglutathione lyase family enzyme